MFARNNLRLSSWRNRANKKTEQLQVFPEHVLVPKYSVGDRCRWIPLPETEWGTIIGLVYMPGSSDKQSSLQWVWVYLLLLDLDSPSRGWVDADWVEEEDLELFSSQTPSTNSSCEEML